MESIRRTSYLQESIARRIKRRLVVTLLLSGCKLPWGSQNYSSDISWEQDWQYR